MIQKRLGIGLLSLVLVISLGLIMGVQGRLDELTVHSLRPIGSDPFWQPLAQMSRFQLGTDSPHSPHLYSLGQLPVPIVLSAVDQSQIEDEALESDADLDTTPLDSFFLDVMPQRSRQSIKFDPPAIAIQVRLDAADMILRCGDKWQTYACSPGKTLTIRHETDQLIPEFWVQNESDHHARIRIQIIEQLTDNQQNLEDA